MEWRRVVRQSKLSKSWPILNVTTDYSVLVIAIHSAIQVFRPSALASSDGLHPFRHYIYVGAFLVPAFMAGMAFINPYWGYMSQGAFCTLPIRPFWYRLALAWIPRYMIAIIILGLAVAIYTHVGFEFRNFSQVGQSIDTSISTITPMLSACDVEDATAGENSEPPETAERQVHMNSERRASSVVHEVVVSRRESAVAFVLDNTAESRLHPPGTRSHSVPTNPRNPHPPTVPIFPPLSISQALESAAKPASNRATAPSPSPSHTNSRNPSPLSICPTSDVQGQLVQERARIHRQLRLMFIYPLTYILMWLIPFVFHCMMYQDKWAAHPVHWLTMLSTICVALMGAVDCLIFSLRERPWRHIIGGDGTFRGSFICWKRPDTSSGGARRARESDATLRRSFTSRNNVDANPRQMCMRMERTEESFMAPSISRTNRSNEVRTSNRDIARMRLDCQREDRRIEKLRREIAIQDGDGEGDGRKESV